jgi:hypothetical protein
MDNQRPHGICAHVAEGYGCRCRLRDGEKSLLKFAASVTAITVSQRALAYTSSRPGALSLPSRKSGSPGLVPATPTRSGHYSFQSATKLPRSSLRQNRICDDGYHEYTGKDANERVTGTIACAARYGLNHICVHDADASAMDPQGDIPHFNDD